MLTGAEWARYFTDFHRSAFRLETLPVYRVPDEEDEIKSFLAGESLPVDYHYPWLDTVANARRAGKMMQRVHVVTRPLTDYLRYEFSWGYAYNVAAGEDIRILDVTDNRASAPPSEDFWLFDEEVVVLMRYAEDGTQIGREIAEDADPADYIARRDLALARAVPFEQYWTPSDA